MRLRRIATAIGCGAIIAGAALVSVHVAAAVEAATTDRGRLVVSSDPDPARWVDVQPGDILKWRIRAALEGAPRGSLAMRLDGGGPLLAEGLRVGVEQCPMEGDADVCTGSRSTVVANRLRDIGRGQRWQLLPITTRGDVGLFITLTVPADADRRTADVAIGLTAAGDDAPRPGPDPLAYTGMTLLGPLLLGLGLLTVGIAARVAGRKAS